MSVRNKMQHAFSDLNEEGMMLTNELGNSASSELIRAGGTHQQTRQILEREINCLEARRKVNPNVRDKEIEFFAEQWKTLDLVLEAASPRLDAVRIIITT